MKAIMTGVLRCCLVLMAQSCGLLPRSFDDPPDHSRGNVRGIRTSQPTGIQHPALNTTASPSSRSIFRPGKWSSPRPQTLGWWLWGMLDERYNDQPPSDRCPSLLYPFSRGGSSFPPAVSLSLTS
ncbi:hypothetical protein VTN77DRAFT_2749 [Rasamsonia byssochlamydoides]|uniref:uncharacterized protein n=1 Tax=Rasamsonia byssochlamydoides TaxID=89139 RepID=UPI0037436B70